MSTAKLEMHQTQIIETKKVTKISLDELFNQSEDDIIIQWQAFPKEFREEFCNLLGQTSVDKKMIGQKAEMVSKAYVACVLDYRGSVVRHAIFAMDVFTQVPSDVVNKERIQSEITRLKDDWHKYKKFYEIIKPLANGDKIIGSNGLSILHSKWVRTVIWKIVGHLIAAVCVWFTLIGAVFCNSIAKMSKYGNPQMEKRVEKLALTTNPNQMVKCIGDKVEKVLGWNREARFTYHRLISIIANLSCQNLRLTLIFNFILFIILTLWYLFC